MKNKENTDEIENKIKHIKNTLKSNRSKALGIAVILTVNTSLIGCSNNKSVINDSYLLGRSNNQSATPSPTPTSSPTHGRTSGGGYHGGSYYYSRGGSYMSGSWGKYSASKSSIGSSSYGRGGSVGIGG